MKAVVAYGAADLRISEKSLPSRQPGQAIVRIVYGGICGSDLHYAQHGRNGIYELREPLTLGHEVVGIVADAAEDGNVAVGTAVAIHPGIPTPKVGAARGSGMNLALGGSYLGSASTTPHTQGGFAEYLAVQADQLRVLPKDLSLRRAVLTEPLAVAIHAVGLLGDRVLGARVLVSGSGPIGILAVAALCAAGAARITASDLHRVPLDTALMVGANEVLQLGVDEAAKEDSFDIVVEAAGAVQSLANAVRVVRRGGAILQLGMLPAGKLSLALAPLISKEVLLQGAQRFDSEIDEAIVLLQKSPEIEAVISHEFPIDGAVEAFSCAADSARSAKVILAISPDSSGELDR